MRCRHARRALWARSDDRLGFEPGLALEEHLERCADCRALADALDAVDAGLARMPEPSAERLDLDAAVAGVRARIEAEGAEEPRASESRRRRIAGVAAAALAATLLGALAWNAADDGTKPADEGEPLATDRAPGGSTNDGRVADGTDAISNAHDAGAPVADAAPPEPEPIDPERVRAARDHLRTTLAAAAPSLPRGASAEEARDFTRSVDATLAEHGDWPWRRMTARLLADQDAETARAAARTLGADADPLAARELADALDATTRGGGGARGTASFTSGRFSSSADSSPEGAPTDSDADAADRARRARVLALALRDADALEGRAVVRALRDPVRSEGVLAAVADAPAERRVSVLREALALDSTPRPFGAREGDLAETATRDTLLDALADCGSASLPALLAAGARGTLEEDALAERLEGRAWSEAALLHAARDARSGAADEIALRLAARLAGAEALGALEPHLVRGPLQAAALDAAARTASPEAFALLVDLHDRGRLGFDETDRALHALVERAPEAVAEAVRASLADAERAERAAGWALALETSAATPALRAVVAAESLGEPLRRDAARAIGSLGGPDEAGALAEIVRGLGEDDAQLAAACLVAAHRLGGEPAARRALEGASDADARALLTLLDRAARRDREPSVHRVARALEPALADRSSRGGSTP